MTNDVQVINISTLADISDAIKEQEGSTEGIPVPDFGKRIRAIPKAKPEQTKTVEITKNGATEIFPDEGYTLSKVTANVSVGGGENKLAKLVDKTITEVTAEDLEGAVSIGYRAFLQCESLERVTIPNSAKNIDKYAFFRCYALTSIKIGNGVTSIGQEAFNDCKGLTSVTIPDNVTTIDTSAFVYCDNLTSIKIGNGVTSIRNAFTGCTALADIYIDAPEDSISGAPWGAPNSPTIHWNTPLPSEEV